MNEWLNTHIFQRFLLDVEGGMVHAGLPSVWVFSAMLVMGLLLVYALVQKKHIHAYVFHFNRLPMLGKLFTYISQQPDIQVVLRMGVVAVFLLIIYAGLFGTPIAEKNIATTLTWTIWWTAVIISILFMGTAWCAVCPWDSLASWLVKRRFWYRGNESTSLNLKVPSWLRNVWPASLMFIGLTWMELGMGITNSPYATAVLSLLMLVMAVVSLSIFERKAFCRHFCPVGRTIGAYADLAPVKLSPIDPEVCAHCTSMECFHGTDTVDPCPTHLVMGYSKTNTYCTSCGACSISCPHKNVNWTGQLNRVSDIVENRLNPSEASFILILVALTSFHGVTMLPIWETTMQRWGVMLNDQGQLLWSFSLGMLLFLLIPFLLYSMVVKLTYIMSKHSIDRDRLFSLISLPLLPLAFCYHIAHNLTHLVRESTGMGKVFLNPLGEGALPFSMSEIHERHLNPLIADDITFALQASLIILGFWWAIRLLLPRIRHIQTNLSSSVLAIPATLFLLIVSLFNLWLLMQPMVMRM